MKPWMAIRVLMMHGVASDWSQLLHPVHRGVPSKTQSYDETIDFKKSNLSRDHRSGCSLGGRPSLREDLRVPIRRIDQGVSESNTCNGTAEHCSVPVPPFWSVTGHCRELEIKKRGRWKSDNSVAQYEKNWKTGAVPVRSQQKSTNLLRSHRLSSRGAYLWKTLSRGRFAALSDGVAASS